MKEKRILKEVDSNRLTRALKDEQGNKILEGYASVFNQRSKLLFEDGKVFYEVIERGAFNEVLGANSLDVVLTYQHNRNEPLARLNKSKGIETLSLSVDEYGLKFRAILNNTTVANDTYARVKSGECFECSFVFAVSSSNERWEKEEGENVRYISKVSGLYDVSVVVDGAYSNTDIAIAERSFKEHSKNKAASKGSYLEQLRERKLEIEQLESKTFINVDNKKINEMRKEEKDLLKYDLAKAIREHRKGGLTGLEAELDQEGRSQSPGILRSPTGFVIPSMVMRSFTKAANTGHHSEKQGGFDVIADRGLLEFLGVTVYEDLTDQIKLIFSEGFEAQFLAEGATGPDGQGDETYGKIEPKRIQGFSTFANEFLAQSSTTPKLMTDMAGAIETATAKEVLKKIIALPALTGFDKAAEGASLTYANIMKLKAAVKSSQFKAPRYVADGELFANLEAVSKDAGSGQYVVENNKLGAYPAIDAQGLMAATTGAKHQLLFGDFSKAYVGYFGGVEVLTDPYTESDKGQTKITFSRYGDVAINPNAFKSIQNATI